MPNPLRARTPSLSYASAHIGWLRSVRENLREAFAAGVGLPRPANGAPIHLVDGRGDQSSRTRAAQAGSACVHALLCAALLLAASHLGKKTDGRMPQGAEPLGPLTFEAPKWMQANERPSLGMHGGGGERNPLPPTAGELAPHARIEFAPPRFPDGRQHPLAVPVTIYDPEAPQFEPPVKDLGLPWLNEMTNSAGSGTNGIGSQRGQGMGDVDGNGAGRGNNTWPYARTATPALCKYCPDPTYTDEARRAKLQGTVTLRVLVGEDGRAHEIRVMKGIGLGLDERAEEAVRSWQFIPAMDAVHRAVPSWVMIETTYRLF